MTLRPNRIPRQLLATTTMVPTTAQVRAGAAVSIILKQDQRTGRQVQGLVQDLLTRGNHPRGIKVRLQDGRIGRVQRMLGAENIEPTSDGALQKDLREQQLARGAGGAGGAAGADRGNYRSETLGVRYTDVRNEDVAEAPPTERDLMDYVKPARQKKNRRKGGRGESPAATEVTATELTATTAAPPAEILTSESAMVTCPVCNAFDGDETAVARHVESHFS